MDWKLRAEWIFLCLSLVGFFCIFIFWIFEERRFEKEMKELDEKEDFKLPKE
jgi:preprotein translocase subunit YajC